MSKLLDDPDLPNTDRPGMAAHSFEVLLVRDLGAKFAQRKLVVSELLASASSFHDRVGARLVEWQAKPPKISDGKLAPASVSTKAMRDQVEREALDRAGG